MDDLHKAFRAIADSLIDYVQGQADTKYGPVARGEKEFQGLVEAGNFENVFISRLPGDQYARQKEIDGIPTLLVDTISIPDDVLFEHSTTFRSIFSEQGGMAIGNRAQIASSLTDENSDAHTVYEQNAGRIPPKLLPVFEEALVLREVERRKNLSRGTVYDWRGEIADSYSENGNDPEHAQTLISLCSTGYFDEGELFDEMYNNLVESGEYSLHQFRELIGRYVKKNPFAVFVRADGMSGEEVYYMATGKLNNLGNFNGTTEPLGYVEICGKGYDTHPVIDTARDRLNADQTNYQMSTRYNPDIDQKILRVSQ